MTQKHSLQYLVSEIQKSKTEISKINNEIAVLTKERNRLSNYIRKTEQKIPKAEVADVVISEHALLRWIEREVGIDTELHRQKILSKELVDAIKKIKGKGILELNNLVYVVNSYVIVSVYPKK